MIVVLSHSVNSWGTPVQSRRITAIAVAALAVGLLLAGASVGAGSATAARCDFSSVKVPPSVPDPMAPQSGLAVAIGGGYYGVGGPGPLDSYGCVAGQEVYDTRILPPRAEFVIVVAITKCTPGAVLPTAGTSIRGLGANFSNITLRCTSPDARGNTAYVSALYGINPRAVGTITATVNHFGSLVTAQSRAAMPVPQPA